jgi:hypothetical protein
VEIASANIFYPVFLEKTIRIPKKGKDSGRYFEQNRHPEKRKSAPPEGSALYKNHQPTTGSSPSEL